MREGEKRGVACRGEKRGCMYPLAGMTASRKNVSEKHVEIVLYGVGDCPSND